MSTVEAEIAPGMSQVIAAPRAALRAAALRSVFGGLRAAGSDEPLENMATNLPPIIEHASTFADDEELEDGAPPFVHAAHSNMPNPESFLEKEEFPNKKWGAFDVPGQFFGLKMLQFDRLDMVAPPRLMENEPLYLHSAVDAKIGQQQHYTKDCTGVKHACWGFGIVESVTGFGLGWRDPG